MAEINDLTTSDASNTARFPEGQNPSTVNDGGRGLEGMLGRAFKDTIDGVLVTGGTSTAYTLTPNRSLSTSYYDGLRFCVEFNAACGAGPTMNVGSVGAKYLAWPDGTSLTTSDVISGAFADIMYDDTNSRWIVMSVQNPPYRAGTWTPVLTFETEGDLSVAYSAQVGRYFRFGSIVHVTFSIITSTFTHGTASGDLLVTGLPFTAVNVSSLLHYGPVRWQGITKANYTDITAQLGPNSTQMNFNASGSGQTRVDVQASDMPTGGTVNILGSLTYLV